MRLNSNIRTISIFLGDAVILVFSLWLSLTVRYWSVPSLAFLESHLTPFSILFVVWFAVFFIYDLYGQKVLFWKKKTARAVLSAQLANIVIAISFFYLIPYFVITPKTILFVFLIISTSTLILWRRIFVPAVFKPTKRKIIFACSGPEVEELKKVFAENKNFGVEVVGFDGYLNKDTTVIFNSHSSTDSEQFPYFYKLLFSGLQFADLEDVYEEILGSIPVSVISERWFLEHISNQPKFIYDHLKRFIDVLIGSVFATLSLPLYPVVWFLLKIDSPGSLFSYQTRVGQNGRPINLIKFRTMTKGNDGGVWNKDNENKVTRLGGFLRKTRVDELPQLWNVVKGDISLIGPRPEFPGPVEAYSEKIPFYNIRHIIKPGLSGWAQIYHERHPHHGLDIIETRNKLSYDLYYIKYRSIWLDVKIILKTIAVLLSVKGS